ASLGVEITREERLRLRAIVVRTGADVEERERLVRTDDDRVGMLVEDVHGDAIVTRVALEDELGAREVDVRLVARADLLDRETEDLRSKPLADDHVPRVPLVLPSPNPTRAPLHERDEPAAVRKSVSPMFYVAGWVVTAIGCSSRVLTSSKTLT